MPSPRVRLLLAAFPPELAGLAVAPPPGWVTACTGVGAIAAAIETARLLALHAPERVLFLGTCGAYDARLAPGDLIAAGRAVASSIDERQRRAYRPTIEQTEWACTWELPLPHHDVVVPPAITLTEEGARELAQLGAAEHLELTGILAACAAQRVPAAAALAVANRVGPGAHAEWQARHAAVSRALVDALAQRDVFSVA